MSARRFAMAARGMAPATVAGALALTCAGLLWLALSARLSAVGSRIDRLQGQRSELLERRSEALLAFADATDPRVLEARAKALGLGPAAPGRTLSLAPSGSSGMAGASALSIMLDQRLPRAGQGAETSSASRTAVPTVTPGTGP